MRIMLTTWSLALLMSITPSGAVAQSSSGGPSAERFLGSWVLVDWRSTNDSGEVTFSFGEEASGQIVYTRDGRMSAQLMNPLADPPGEPNQFLSYWGGYEVDLGAGTVTHKVIGANLANLIGSDQVRNFEFEGPDRLVLSLGENRLIWERTRTQRR